MYEIKKTKYEAKGIFLELKNDGNNSFTMLPELVPSGCMSMPWGFFFKWWPWVDLDNFYDCVKFVSWRFCMGDSLYSIVCSCISKFVLIQHILSTQVSDTGPMVLWFMENWQKLFFNYHQMLFLSVPLSQYLFYQACYWCRDPGSWEETSTDRGSDPYEEEKVRLIQLAVGKAKW